MALAPATPTPLANFSQYNVVDTSAVSPTANVAGAAPNSNPFWDQTIGQADKPASGSPGSPGSLGTSAALDFAAVAPSLLGGSGSSAATNNITGGATQAALASAEKPSGVQTAQQDLGLAKSAAGLAGAAANYAGDASLAGDLGTVGQYAGYAAIPLDVYNFVKNDQSGATGADAINGAESGASIGTAIVPGIGTAIGAVAGAVVGAISSAFGGGELDPENANWDKFVPAYNGLSTTDQQQMLSQLNPSTTFQLFAGVMDAKDPTSGHSEELEQAFGKGSENQIMTQMAQQINGAISTGKVAANASASQLYSSVVTPWLQSKGVTVGMASPTEKGAIATGGGTEGAAMQGVLTSLIGQWQTGQLTSSTKVGVAGQAITGLPTYGAAPAKAAPATTTATPARAVSVGPQSVAASGRYLAKGGFVKSTDKSLNNLGGNENQMVNVLREYLKLKGVPGYADGGDVTEEDKRRTQQQTARNKQKGVPDPRAAAETSRMLRTMPNPQRFAKGYADGGDVSNPDAFTNDNVQENNSVGPDANDVSPVEAMALHNNAAAAQRAQSPQQQAPQPAAAAPAAQAAPPAQNTQGGQPQPPGPVTTAVAQGLTAIGGDPSTAPQIAASLKSANPNVPEDQLAQSVGVNFQSMVQSPDAAQSDVNQQRLANLQKAQQIAGSYQARVSGLALSNNLGAAGAKSIVDSEISNAFLGSNVGQENVNATLATQKQGLENQGAAIGNANQVQTAEQNQVKTQEQQLLLQQQQVKTQQQELSMSPGNSPYAQAYVRAAQAQLNAIGHPGAKQIAQNINGMTPFQVDSVLDGTLGAGTKSQAIKSSAASAAQASAGATWQQGLNKAAGFGPGGSLQPTAGGTLSTDFYSIPKQKSQIGAVYNQVKTPQVQQSQEQYGQLYGQLANEAPSRQQAETYYQELIGLVKSYNGPTGPGSQQVAQWASVSRQLQSKIGNQLVASMGAGGTDASRSILQGGFPSLDHIRDKNAVINQLAVQLSVLQKADMMSSEANSMANGGYMYYDPTDARAATKSYQFVSPNGNTVVRTYGNSASEQAAYKKDLLQATASRSKVVPLD